MENKKKKGTKVLFIILSVIIGLVLLLGTAALITFRHFYNKTNFVDDTETPETTAVFSESESEEAIATVESEIEESIISDNELTVEEVEEGALENIYNLLLIGVDRRDKSWNGNSDAMILITINRNTKTIYMTSFMRDLYANIEGVGVRKLNHAYAVGAGPLLVNTLETNYGVYIDNYASVDFSDIRQVIDVLGGVDIEIKDYELSEMAAVGIYNTGMQHLNGAQALAYSRIRYHGNADFERTQRQRTVLLCLMEKARSMSVLEMASMADQVLPLVTHNLSSTETLNLMKDLPTVLKYKTEEIRIPADKEYHSYNEILIPNDINDTVTRLRERIYAKEAPKEEKASSEEGTSEDKNN